MNKNTYKSIALALVLVLVVPMLCSCKYTKKAKIVKAADAFGAALTTGDASDILKLTDGLDKDFKTSFKQQFNKDNYTEEELIYIDHMLKSISYTSDGSTVEVDKETGSCVVDFEIADHTSLMDGDFKDIDALGNAIDSCDKRHVSIRLEFALVEKEWYVTNLNDVGFTDLFSFLNEMPPIGKSSLIDTANVIAKAIVSDDAGVIVIYATSETDNIDLPSYISNLFDVDGTPTDEEKAFREAVRSTMSYEVDASSLVIDSKRGSIDIYVTMADYETLAGTTFKKVADIAPAVEACPTKTYKYTCELVRNGCDWFAVNITSDEFSDILKYKDFSISLKNIDGTYTSTVDVTDKFVAYVEAEYGIKMPKDLEGRIYINCTLVLKNGQYEVTVDRDAFVTNIKTFVETNIDKIIMNMLGTTSPVGLDALAKIAGYKDYADMRQSVLNEVTTNLETINTSGLESSGTFTTDEDKITLKSSTDTMPGTIDSYGVITITSPVNDADAKKLLGSDTITLAFKKA